MTEMRTVNTSSGFPKGKSFGGGSYFFSEVVFNDMVGVERETVRDREKFNAETGKMLWAGMRRKYVAAVIKFPEASEATLLAEHFTARGSDSKDPGTYKLTVSDNMNGANSLAFDFMILPLNWQDIKSFDLGFEKIIVSGWRWCGRLVCRPLRIFALAFEVLLFHYSELRCWHYSDYHSGAHDYNTADAEATPFDERDEQAEAGNRCHQCEIPFGSAKEAGGDSGTLYEESHQSDGVLYGRLLAHADSDADFLCALYGVRSSD